MIKFKIDTKKLDFSSLQKKIEVLNVIEHGRDFV